MSGIHENNLKWSNEQLKKKYKTKINNISVEEDLKQCIYCPKVFLHSSFVIKHIFRRHAEQFLYHHKKFVDSTAIKFGLDSETALINYLKGEFSDVKAELRTLKQPVTHHTHPSDYPKNQVECSAICQEGNIPTVNKLSLNIPEDNVTKEDFIKLQAKVEEVYQKCSKNVLLNKEMAVLQENRICKRLKNELLTDFENLLIRYQDQNSEWKSHLLQLKRGLNKLEHAVEMNTKKIESPEALMQIENKIDEQIKSFYENYGIFEERKKTSSKCGRKSLSDSSSSVHRANRRKKSLYTSTFQGRPHIGTTTAPQMQDVFETDASRFLGHTLQWKQPGTPNDLQPNVSRPNTSKHQDLTFTLQHLEASGETSDPQSSANSSKARSHKSYISKEDPADIPEIGKHRAKVLFIEKLRDFGISHKTAQMSTEEYETKMNLVQAQKELNCRKYKNFQRLYQGLDSHANEMVKSRMDKRFRKQLRFTDSMHFHDTESKDISSDQEKEKSLSPVEKINSPFMRQSEFLHCGKEKALSPSENVNSPFMNQPELVQDFGASGDFDEVQNIENRSNSKRGRNNGKGDGDFLPNRNTEVLNFQEHLDSRNVASGSSMTGPKLFNDPPKSFYHKSAKESLKPIEEFSELSSLESDTNVSENEFDKSSVDFA